MKRPLGTAALILGMTLTTASGSWAQAGRDSPQGSAGMENSTGGSMGQPKGSMKGSGAAMQNGTMHNGTSGNKVQSGGTNNH
jgi:hypothetical protein